MIDEKPTSRRNFLVKSVVLIPGAATVAACAPRPAPPGAARQAAAQPEPDLADYRPAFFNADEWAFIKAAVDRLIPADEHGPGGLEANVPVFIDRQMDAGFGHASNWYRQGPFKADAAALWGYQGPLVPRDLYRASIAAIDAHCRSVFSNQAFAALEPARQDQLLKDMENGALELEQVSVRDFFTFLLQNTKEGYLADPMYGGNKGSATWKMIGFPGARADYLDWVGRDEKYPFDPVAIGGNEPAKLP